MFDYVFFVLTFVAALGSGLMGGVFYAFSTAVMRALAALPPAQGAAAMQSINLAVVNPWFLSAIFGTTVLSLMLAAASLFLWRDAGTAYLLGGAALYLIGGIGVTIAFNVPLNNALAATQPASPEGATVWTGYLANWTWWNHVRSASCLTAAALFIGVLIVRAGW